MREIKFRAWDREHGCFTYGVMLRGCPMSLSSHHPELIGRQMEDWQEFTGLKDKNGKDIYEGDIVQWTDGTGEKALIQWWDGDACFEESPTLNGLAHACGGYTVIGNIYENPELLSK